MQAAIKRSRLIPSIVRRADGGGGCSGRLRVGAGGAGPITLGRAAGGHERLALRQGRVRRPSLSVPGGGLRPGIAGQLSLLSGRNHDVARAVSRRAGGRDQGAATAGAAGHQHQIVAIEGDDVATLPRMYKTRRLTVAADASQEHVHSGLLMGEKASVSLISSSRDEKAANTSYAQYAMALMLLLHLPRDQKQ